LVKGQPGKPKDLSKAAETATRLLTGTSVAIDGSKFKAVITRDKNFTQAQRR
jgi:hypothetical protein